MPKDLIPAHWVLKPCRFLLSPKSARAELCAECEGEFSWLSLGNSSKRHCMFCGYLFHRSPCTRKIQVEGQFFRQRICSRCYYYRNTAADKLKAGEEFECIGQQGGSQQGGSNVVISLCEDTAEVLLHWKDKEVKQTTDLAMIEVRKGFSHVHQDTTGQYEPLRSFSLFLKDNLGDQCAYHLRANSALSCHLWVEGLKAANYVYHKMQEQEKALEYYSEKDMNTERAGLWYRQLYLPGPEQQSTPPSPPSPAPEDSFLDEEWEDISPLYTPTSLFSNLASPGSLHANSSGYQSDLSLSLCSSLMHPQQRTVHSLNLTSSCRQPSSRPHMAPTSSHKQWSAVSSLPPSVGPAPTPASGAPFSPTCSCHFRVVPSQSFNPSHSPKQDKPHSNPSLHKCCENCKDSCRLAHNLFN